MKTGREITNSVLMEAYKVQQNPWWLAMGAALDRQPEVRLWGVLNTERSVD